MSKPINFITVGCNPRTMQTIALNCRCGLRWTERIPKELHDSTMQCIFECAKCGRVHILENKQLRSIDKERFNHDGYAEDTRPFARIKTDDIKYDA